MSTPANDNPSSQDLAGLGLTKAPGMPFTYTFDPTSASALVPSLGMHLAAAAQASGGSSSGGSGSSDTFNKVAAAAGIGLGVLAVAVPGPGTVVAGIGGAIIGGAKLISELAPKSSPPSPATPPDCCNAHTCQPDRWSYASMCARSNGIVTALDGGTDWLTGWIAGSSPTDKDALVIPGLIPHPYDGSLPGLAFIRFTPNPRNKAPVSRNPFSNGLPNFEDFYLPIFEAWWQSWCNGCQDPSTWPATFTPALLLAEAIVAWNNKWKNYDGAWTLVTLPVKSGTPSLVNGQKVGTYIVTNPKAAMEGALVQGFLKAAGQELCVPNPIAYSLHFICPDAPPNHAVSIQFSVWAPTAKGAAQEAADQKAMSAGAGGELTRDVPTGTLAVVAAGIGAVLLALLLL